MWSRDCWTSDCDDTVTYKLSPVGVKVQQMDKSYLALNDLDGLSLGLHVGDPMWSTQFQSLLGDDYANYEEYQGSYDADTSTFTFTQGVSFSMGFQEEYLDTPISFTAAEWLSTMVEVWDAGTEYESSFVRNLGVWSRDTNQWYDISSNALTDPTATAAGQGVRTETNKWVSPTVLGTGFNLNCIENCLSAAKVQTTFVDAMAMVASGDFSSSATSPYLSCLLYTSDAADE